MGVLDQFMGNVIEDTETVAENGCKFFVQSCGDYFRQGIAVNFVSLF